MRDALHRRDLAFDDGDDIEDADLIGGAGERVAAVDAAGALDEPAAAELRRRVAPGRRVAGARHAPPRRCSRARPHRPWRTRSSSAARSEPWNSPASRTKQRVGRWDRTCGGARRPAPGSRESLLSWSELYSTRPSSEKEATIAAIFSPGGDPTPPRSFAHPPGRGRHAGDGLRRIVEPERTHPDPADGRPDPGPLYSGGEPLQHRRGADRHHRELGLRCRAAPRCRSKPARPR